MHIEIQSITPIKLAHSINKRIATELDSLAVVGVCNDGSLARWRIDLTELSNLFDFEALLSYDKINFYFLTSFGNLIIE